MFQSPSFPAFTFDHTAPLSQHIHMSRPSMSGRAGKYGIYKKDNAAQRSIIFGFPINNIENIYVIFNSVFSLPQRPRVCQALFF
jgi:hypothetical protein